MEQEINLSSIEGYGQGLESAREIAVLMICFIRREPTLKSIAAVKMATRTPHWVRIS